MDKTLIYIDQNIIGLYIDGLINLKKDDNLVWVYSEEHFSEIRRSKTPEKYLIALSDIDAKILKLVTDENHKITENAKLLLHGTPQQHYADYIHNQKESELNLSILDPFAAWVNGGGNADLLKQTLNKLVEQIKELTYDMPFIQKDLLCKIDTLTPDFNKMTSEMISNGNDIKKAREMLGGGKGAIGSIQGEHQIEKIWKMISPVFENSNLSCDQFFSFDPIVKQGYDSWPLYLGIIGCCTVMDVLGFQSEKKCRKISKISNVRSDAHHIALGHFCSAIMSKDKKLINRARAIYEYKNVSTKTLLVK